MIDAEEKIPTGLHDVPLAPEVFAQGACGFSFMNGNITITFETSRSDYSTQPPGMNRIVVGRLVLPVHGAQALVVGLNDFLEKHHLDPSQSIVGEATRQ